MPCPICNAPSPHELLQPQKLLQNLLDDGFKELSGEPGTIKECNEHDTGMLTTKKLCRTDTDRQTDKSTTDAQTHTHTHTHARTHAHTHTHARTHTHAHTHMHTHTHTQRYTYLPSPVYTSAHGKAPSGADSPVKCIQVQLGSIQNGFREGAGLQLLAPAYLQEPPVPNSDINMICLFWSGWGGRGGGGRGKGGNHLHPCQVRNFEEQHVNLRYAGMTA